MGTSHASLAHTLLGLALTAAGCSGSDDYRGYDLSCTGSYQTRASGYGLGGTCTFTQGAAMGSVAVCARVLILSPEGQTLTQQDVRGTLAAGQTSLAVDYWIPQAAPASGGSPRAWRSGYCAS